jgi:hypothetical protein
VGFTLPLDIYNKIENMRPRDRKKQLIEEMNQRILENNTIWPTKGSFDRALDRAGIQAVTIPQMPKQVNILVPPGMDDWKSRVQGRKLTIVITNTNLTQEEVSKNLQSNIVVVVPMSGDKFVLKNEIQKIRQMGSRLQEKLGITSWVGVTHIGPLPDNVKNSDEYQQSTTTFERSGVRVYDNKDKMMSDIR